MASKKKPEEKDYTDKVTRTYVANVEGVDFELMIESAKVEGARTWGVPVDWVYVSGNGAMTPATYSRFEDNKRITTFTMQVVIGMIPDEARTGGHLASVAPITEEEDSPDG